MKYATLLISLCVVACSQAADWQEPTEAAIAAWNAAHPAAPLTDACEDRVRAIRFELGAQDRLDVACGDTRGVSGCVDTFDVDSSRAWIRDDAADNWRVFAHEAMHVAHACAQHGDLDGHHTDALLWAHDPADALHI